MSDGLGTDYWVTPVLDYYNKFKTNEKYTIAFNDEIYKYIGELYHQEIDVVKKRVKANFTEVLKNKDNKLSKATYINSNKITGKVLKHGFSGNVQEV